MHKANLRLLVSGPYGGVNYGDDAIALVICAQLKMRGIDIVLAVNNIENSKRIYRDTILVDRLDLRHGKLSCIRTIRDCDAVLVGGGEQLSEPRVPNPIWGHLATNIQLCLISKILRKKCALIAVGVDDGISLLGRHMMKWGLKATDFIGVRDFDSKSRIESIFNNQIHVFLGADPVFLMEPVRKVSARRTFIENNNLPSDAKIILIMPSIDKIHSLSYLKEINTAVNSLAKGNMYLFFAISDKQESYDMRLFSESMLYTNVQAKWLDPRLYSFDDTLNAIAAADCVISSRMHPIILSAINRTPFICLCRSAKMISMMEMLDCREYFNLNSFDSYQLVTSLHKLVSSNSAQFFVPIEQQIKELKHRASSQFDAMVKAIG